MWECDQDLSTEIVHDFFQSKYFSHGIEPIPGAYETLLALSQHVDLEVVTSRQHAIQVLLRWQAACMFKWNLLLLLLLLECGS